MKKLETPKNECKGCAARDRIIARISDHADRLQKQMDDIFKTLESKVPSLRKVK